jgi:hypothetical protein
MYGVPEDVALLIALNTVARAELRRSVPRAVRRQRAEADERRFRAWVASQASDVGGVGSGPN